MKVDPGPRDVESQAREGGGGTCDEGGHAPAQHVVETHGAGVDVAHLGERPVQVQGLQQGPGEGAEVQEVQQDGDDCASKLGARPRQVSDQGTPRARIPSYQAAREGWGVGGASGSVGQREVLLGCRGSEGELEKRKPWAGSWAAFYQSSCCRSRDRGRELGRTPREPRGLAVVDGFWVRRDILQGGQPG